MSAKLTFFQLLKNIFDIVVKAGIKKALAGAGIALTSMSFVLVIFNYFVTKLFESISLLDDDLVNLFGLFGVDKALSIVVGAYTIRLMILSSKLAITKSQS